MATGDPGELIEALTGVASLVQRALDRCASAHGISASQARLLRTLGGRAPTINELSQLLGLDKSSTSGLVDRAQQRGLVRRVPSQLDRRSVRARLTGEGRQLAASLSAQLDAELAAALEPLSAEDRAALVAAGARLLGD